MIGAEQLSLLAVFLTGLLGGVHCAGMCGGIVAALSMTHRTRARALRDIPVRLESTVATVTPGSVAAASGIGPGTGGSRLLLHPVLLYNLGRVTTYVLLGAVAGAVGSLGWMTQSVLPVQKGTFFISNLLLIVMGLYILGVRQLVRFTESAGTVLWNRIKPAATRTLKGQGGYQALLAGSLWGLVPCGLIYAVLAMALVSGSAGQGALLLLVFGLGTLPNLLALGLFSRWLSLITSRIWIRKVMGLLIMSFGVLGIWHLVMTSSA